MTPTLRIYRLIEDTDESYAMDLDSQRLVAEKFLAVVGLRKNLRVGHGRKGPRAPRFLDPHVAKAVLLFFTGQEMIDLAFMGLKVEFNTLVDGGPRIIVHEFNGANLTERDDPSCAEKLPPAGGVLDKYIRTNEEELGFVEEQAAAHAAMTISGALQAAKITVAELASRVDTSELSISKFLEAKGILGLRMFARIARALDCQLVVRFVPVTPLKWNAGRPKDG
jgi:hypothetical protein